MYTVKLEENISLSHHTFGVAPSRNCGSWGTKNALSAAIPFLVNRVSIFGHLHLATSIEL